MHCANQKLEPILGLLAQDVEVPGAEVSRVKDRLFAVVPVAVEVLPGNVAAKVLQAAEKLVYRP